MLSTPANISQGCKSFLLEPSSLCFLKNPPRPKLHTSCSAVMLRDWPCQQRVTKKMRSVIGAPDSTMEARWPCLPRHQRCSLQSMLPVPWLRILPLTPPSHLIVANARNLAPAFLEGHHSASHRPSACLLGPASGAHSGTETPKELVTAHLCRPYGN